MAIWCVRFCGMQWRAIGLLCDIGYEYSMQNVTCHGPA
jgi:hypothetical protein